MVGLAGLVLAGLWGLTDHAMAYCNENLLLVNPLALLLIPAAFQAVRENTRPAWWVALTLVGLSLLGLFLKALPGFDQVNGPVIALALPAQLGVAAAIRRLGKSPVQMVKPVIPSGARDLLHRNRAIS